MPKYKVRKGGRYYTSINLAYKGAPLEGSGTSICDSETVDRGRFIEHRSSDHRVRTARPILNDISLVSNGYTVTDLTS
jgi:hypothetical protein